LFLFLAAPCRACRVSSSAMTRPTSTLLPSLVDNTHLSDPFFLSFILFIPSLLILPQSAPFFCLLPENIPTTDRMYQGKDIGKKDYRRYSAVYPRPYMSVDAVSILPYMQACRLMIVRLQTSYRSRLPSLRRQCLVCVERDSGSLSLFFSHILLVVYHRLLAFNSAYRCTIPLTMERKKNDNNRDTRALGSWPEQISNEPESVGVPVGWCPRDLDWKRSSRYASLFPGNVAHDNKRAWTLNRDRIVSRFLPRFVQSSPFRPSWAQDSSAIDNWKGLLERKEREERPQDAIEIIQVDVVTRQKKETIGQIWLNDSPPRRSGAIQQKTRGRGQNHHHEKFT
jgi:hypothetical protein